VIKFVSDLQQIEGFLKVLQFSPNKTDRHNIADILLKVVLNTITPYYMMAKRVHNQEVDRLELSFYFPETFLVAE
jgi:hypothetical protein